MECTSDIFCNAPPDLARLIIVLLGAFLFSTGRFRLDLLALHLLDL
jgi:hypothetical protein